MIGVLAALYQSCYFAAVALTSVALATLVTIGTAPVIVLGVDRVTGRRTGRLAPVAACLALAGLGLLVGLPSGFAETAVLASAGLAVLAAAGFAAVTLVGARPVPGLDELTVTGFGFTLGGLVLVPVAAALGGLGFRPGPEAVGLLVALGVGPTAMAYTLYFRGLRTAAASTAALLALLEPLTARHPGRGRPRPAAERDRDGRRGDPDGRGDRHVPRRRPVAAGYRGGEGGQQLALPSRGQPGAPRPVQAASAFPRQHVGQQLTARAVPQPGGVRGRAAAGREALPARLGQPHGQGLRAHPLRDAVVGQPGRGGRDHRPGVPAHRPGLLDPVAERHDRAHRVIRSRDPGLGGVQQPRGQVTHVDHLGRRRPAWPARAWARAGHGRPAPPSTRTGRCRRPALRSGRPAR